MKVSFEGVGEQVLSFNKASGVTKGALVKMSANSTVIGYYIHSFYCWP